VGKEAEIDWQREMAALIVQHQKDAYGYEADIEEIMSHPKEWRGGWYQDALAWYWRRQTRGSVEK
jgi:hypothetical protein